MMKLQILVPHYKEPAGVIRPLLDSLAIQQGVDMEDLGVIVAHDGLDAQDFLFPGDVGYGDGDHSLPSYPYDIRQVRIEKGGVSAARNAALDASTADYVMFCDADDMFMNACGLYIVFREIDNGGFDSLVSVFVEETRDPKTHAPVYINHEMDGTFVHGKVHRRKYLLDAGIRWNDSLTVHEDSYFNVLCQQLGKDVKYCPTPFYLWKWRDGSVCRHDPKYILKTYRDMLKSSDALVKEFLSRGRQDKAMLFATSMIFDAYYTMNKPEWLNQGNRGYRDATELAFRDYFAAHKALWEAMPAMDKMAISNQVRGRSIGEGMRMEAVTVSEWLEHVEAL